jgi:FHA domain
MDPKHAQNLKPAEMVSLARAHVRTGFAQAVGAPLLLVRLDDPTGDFALTLEAALEESPTSGGRRPEPSMGFETVIGNVADTMRTASLMGAQPASKVGPAEIGRVLLRSVHFAVPLHKRKGAANIFADRISVGRARTNDVVLRHFSVSKFQAWFECDEDDRFYVADAKSTNPTFLNGTQVPRAAPVAVTPGDALRFGDVAAVFCTPELLWDALSNAPPPSSRSPLSSRSPPRR